jgi:regulatory protein YycI of two-component signal transduction system YycFG
MLIPISNTDFEPFVKQVLVKWNDVVSGEPDEELTTFLQIDENHAIKQYEGEIVVQQLRENQTVMDYNEPGHDIVAVIHHHTDAKLDFEILGNMTVVELLLYLVFIGNEKGAE